MPDESIVFHVLFELVQHYGPTAFTSDWGKNTILTKDPLFQKTIGQRETLSFADGAVINRAYCSGNVDVLCINHGVTKNNGHLVIHELVVIHGTFW